MEKKKPRSIFVMMRYRYTIRVLFFLLENEKGYFEQMHRDLGAGQQSIEQALVVLKEYELIRTVDTRDVTAKYDGLIKHYYILTPKGKFVAEALMQCYRKIENLL